MRRTVKNSYYLTKKRLLKGKKKRHTRGKRRTHKRKYRGGWSQYQNNMPLTPSYSVAGLQNENFPSALANPPPYSMLSNCTNCVDNYNHYTNSGFQSKGSY